MASAVREPKWLTVMHQLEAEGKSLAAVDILSRGRVRLLLGSPLDVALAPKEQANEWDEVLPDAKS